MSGGNYMFMMVAGGEVDMPIYEAEFINTQRVCIMQREEPAFTLSSSQP